MLTITINPERLASHAQQQVILSALTALTPLPFAVLQSSTEHNVGLNRDMEVTYTLRPDLHVAWLADEKMAAFYTNEGKLIATAEANEPAHLLKLLQEVMPYSAAALSITPHGEVQRGDKPLLTTFLSAPSWVIPTDNSLVPDYTTDQLNAVLNELDAQLRAGESGIIGSPAWYVSDGRVWLRVIPAGWRIAVAPDGLSAYIVGAGHDQVRRVIKADNPALCMSLVRTLISAHQNYEYLLQPAPVLRASPANYPDVMFAI